MTDNEINEKYAKEIIEEIDRNCKADVTMDFVSLDDIVSFDAMVSLDAMASLDDMASLKKFQGKTKEEALESARKELGEGIVEMIFCHLGILRCVLFFLWLLHRNDLSRTAVPCCSPLAQTDCHAVFLDLTWRWGKSETKATEPTKENLRGNGLEEKLDNLQNLIEKQLSQQENKIGFSKLQYHSLVDL